MVQSAMSLQGDLIESGGRGFVDKFMGDGLMAYWIVRGDDPATHSALCGRILDVAFKARSGIQSMPIPGRGGRLDLRVGLHIGTVKCGNFGSKNRWTWTLIGDDVNLAARLEQAKEGIDGCKLGQIRVSDAFFNSLTRDDRSHLPLMTRVQAKERAMDVYSSAAQKAARAIQSARAR